MTTTPSSPADGVSRKLAEFLVRARVDALPNAVQHEAKRSLLNFFATALGGCRDAAVEHALKVVSPFAGAKQASIIGRSERLDALNAAFLNAISANVFDFDDTHPGTVIHPSAPVAPALFALAETRGLTGQDLLHAFALGVEVECRIGNAVSPGHYARGWHITSTCGVFGSAVAVGKAIGLNSEQMLWALGAASAQAGGLIETLGTMAKSLSVGNAARNGIVAAFAGQAGITGPEMPLEGPRGFAHVFGTNPDFSQVTDGLGERWEALRNTYKPYPCGIVLHSVLDACLALRREFAPDAAGIETIVVRGHPLLGQRTNRPEVTTGREAQVSAQHSIAVALLTGAAGLEQYSDAAVRDPAVLALRRKVQVQDDATMTIEAAEVIITLRDGRVLSRFVAQARGGEKQPLTDTDLEAKLRDLAAFGKSGCDTSALIDAVWSLETNADAGSIMSLAVPR
ncbi:MAG: MmgE/PrpD family protein [Steroidobacteraceae bacterium]